MINNYDLFTHYFRKEMKEFGLVPSDSLKEFILENTKDLEFMGYKPQDDLEFPPCIFFRNKNTNECCELFVWYKGFLFRPQNYMIYKNCKIQPNEGVLTFLIGKDGYTREILDNNRLICEQYMTSEDKIHTQIYPYSDVMQAYSNPTLTTLNYLGINSYQIVLSMAKIKPTYIITAEMDNYVDYVFFKLKDGKDCNTLYTERVAIRPGVSFYELYKSFLSELDLEHFKYDTKDEMEHISAARENILEFKDPQIYLHIGGKFGDLDVSYTPEHIREYLNALSIANTRQRKPE